MNEQNNHKPGSAASAISERRRMQKNSSYQDRRYTVYIFFDAYDDKIDDR